MRRHSSVFLSESFVSRQGEGKLTGMNSFFIRTSGCNLRCWFCDTPYASWSPTGKTVSLDQLVNDAIQAKVDYVVLTGGEPLLPSAIESLCNRLFEEGLHVTIETAGTIDKPIACDLLSLSPKLAGSTPDPDQHPRWSELHQSRRLPIDIMRRLIDGAKDYQLKFVVSSPDQFTEICSVADQLDVAADDVFIMPEGVTTEAMDRAQKQLRPLTESHGFQYCDRMQIRWYGNRRGT